MSQQIPSLNWIRRTNPLNGDEDLLKQNPLTDAFPQEERIPVSLVSNFTISTINPYNVGSGIGVFDFKNGANIEFRSVQANSSKVSVSLDNKTIKIDASASNIASEISITDLNGIPTPSTSNEYLKWDGVAYVWQTITPYALSFRDTYDTNIGINNGSFLKINGNSPIEAIVNGGNQIDLNFNGGLNNLSDVTISGAVPNGYILAYNTGTNQWEPSAPTTPPSYSFNIKGDAISTDSVTNAATVAILGNGTTITTVLSGSDELTINWTANLNHLSDVSASSPSNNQVLTWNSSTSRWESKNAQSTTVSAENGLTLASNILKLGGVLTQNTVVNGSGSTYSFGFLDLQKFYVETERNNQNFLFRSNEVEAYTEFTATNKNTGVFYEALFHTTGHFMSFQSSPDSSATKKFGVKNGIGYGSLIYQLSGNTQCGFIVEENSIIINDGVTTPSAGHVLTWMADGTSRYLPQSGGGAGADDWGTQVVESDSTLTGDGTLASPLSVAVPLPSGGSNGDYLGYEEGNPIWLSFPNKELVALCEVENTSDVSAITGRLFFTVPPQMASWTLKSYVASVYVLGSGGTTTVEIVKNGSIISGSNVNIDAQYVTKSSINNVVALGDRISINVTTANKTTKDKGLSLTLLFEE